MQYFVDAYLNKKLTPLEKIYKAWYTIFFFGTGIDGCHFNMYVGGTTTSETISLPIMPLPVLNYVNGNSVILLLLIMRDQVPNGNNHFLPWLLASQACKQTFTAVMSMTSTFTIIINFSMLGFLYRLATSLTNSDNAGIRDARN